MNAITPVLGLNKPDILGDEDAWGQETNANWDNLDGVIDLLRSSTVKKAGDTMTGLLILSGPPVDPLGAASKGYVDANFVAKAGGTMTGLLTLSGNPLGGLDAVPRQYADAIATQSDTLYLRKSGGVMTGLLTLSGPPVGTLDAASKAYVDAAVTTVYNPKGSWNATSNTPTLSNGGGGGVKGDIYTVTVAGSTSLDGVSTWAVGDQVQNTGAAWIRIAFSGSFGTMAFQSAASVAITGGTASLTSLTILGGAGSFSLYNEPRNPFALAKLWTDATGNAGGFIQTDGTWQLPGVNIKALTAASATVAALTATTLTTPALNATGGSPLFDSVTVKNAGVFLADPRNPGIAAAWADGAGALNGVVQNDGVIRLQTVAITNLTTTNYTPAGPSAPTSLVFGTSVMAPSDRRNRYAEAWTDGTDQGAFAISNTGSLVFNPASGVLAKHLQSRIERSHVLTQGPPSHGNSANTIGTSGTTYHLTCTLDSGGFDAVRLVIPSMRTPAGATITACVAVAANATDPLNPKDASGNPVAWRPVTFGSGGNAVDWEDQPYGTLSLSTNAVTPVGTNVLSFASTTGVTVGMVAFASPFGSAFGIQLPGAWAQVTAVTPTTVTLNKNIQNLDLGTNWPVWFAPNSFALAAYGGFAAQNGSCANMQVSDWVPISSLDRSDGGRWPLLMVRVYATGGAHNSLVTDLSQTNWQGLADDRVWSCYTQAGDFVSAAGQSGFTNGTDNGTMIVGWLQFYSRSRGCTIMHAGDSITQGVGGLMIGMGATMLAAQALSTPSCPVTAVGVVNGWNNAGVGTVVYDSAISHVDVFKPQVLALAPWTRNGEFSKPPVGFPAYAQEQADWYYQQTQRIVMKAWRKYRTQVLYFPTGASDNAELTAATEKVRVSAVLRARMANASGEMLLDQDALLGTGSTPINTSPFIGLHPPASAQQILALDLQRQYKSALGIA